MRKRNISSIISALLIIILVVSIVQPSGIKSTQINHADAKVLHTRENVLINITLITGDTVFVVNKSGELRVVGVRPRDSTYKNYGYAIIKAQDDLYVIPKDVNLSVFDKSLFNIAYLIREGYYKETEVPLIARTRDGELNRVINELKEDKVTLHGRVISKNLKLLSLKVRKEHVKEAFKALKGTLSRIKKVWLDKKFHVRLEDSVPLINAPEVWDLGVNGSGIKIAILDTGIAYDHPDFYFPNGTSKVISMASFIEEPSWEVGDPYDYDGHGTHVAGIAAGVGGTFDAYSLGPGVAPGALIMVGKVLNSLGYGS